ncbi:Zinc/iron permease [Lipomyces tetrasporus]|uniref:Zinc/iron permease n=1 Tax=Lipomyces tetrasporus TaxID=54092 RepID=A0AAD7VSK0_9ASCO|nr:Zinc/iron permease [Lipomyces tetrasporus]KAJ8099804.1 Zinc/iron permease [Lipomyces tetrasporus]
MVALAEHLLPYLVEALVKRDDGDTEEATPECPTDNNYDGRLGVRISAIFVIMTSSMLGALFPVLTKQSRLHVPEVCYFVAKFFGSGVIIATAFIHLLTPAVEALGDECLGGTWAIYPWAIAIAMISVFMLFFIELVTYRFATFSSFAGNITTHSGDAEISTHDSHFSHVDSHIDTDQGIDRPGAQRLNDKEIASGNTKDLEKASPISESLSAQIAAVFILEFGVIFHSVFIGLALAIAGEEFNTLYVVLVFHQGFEGLGLGTRLASTPWAPNRLWVPIVMAAGYGITTPIAIAIGLGVRYSYSDSSRSVLISNGIFDALSAGILLYTGLVELMAHEFLFSHEMRTAPFSRVLWAFFVMCLGAGLMALLGRWA